MPSQLELARVHRPQIQLPELDLNQRALLDQTIEPRLHEHTSVPSVFNDAFAEKEIDMSIPWGSFAQVVLTNEVKNAQGQMIKKGIGVSIPYPPGVSRKMANEILSLALNFQNPEDQNWKGEGGDIFCKNESVGDAPFDLSFLRRLVVASSVIIGRDHPYKEHESVQKFLSMTGKRLQFIDEVVKDDSARLLTSGEFTGWSSMNPKYQGEGKVYLLEFFKDVDGVVYGSAPDGSKRDLRELATNDVHRDWISDGLIKLFDKKGNVKAGDWEDTDDVSHCGGLDDEEESGCSTFYKIMEGGNIFPSDQLESIRDDYKRLFLEPMRRAMSEEKQSGCQECGKSSDQCDGH